MRQAGERAKLVFYSVLLLLLFFGMIEVFIDGGKKFLLLELLGLLVLVLLSLLAFIGYHDWGKRAFMVVFLLYLLNLILIWLVKGKLYVVLLLLAAVGFGVSVFAEMPREQPRTEPSRLIQPVRSARKEEPHSMVFEPAGAAAASAVSREFKPAKTTAAPAKIFSPGKFVASSQSNQFHAPTCDWAKKIQKQRRVWFQDLDEAFEKGYRKHSCLK